jgi:hypothetical protein
VVRIQAPLVVPAPAGGASTAAKERSAAHAIADTLHAVTADAVVRARADAEPPPGSRRRWTGLTTLFR